MSDSIQYSDYLLTEKWKGISKECKRLAGNKCSECGSTERLETHHTTYENIGNEDQCDLQCLCHNCHEIKHESDMKIKKSSDTPISFSMIGNGKTNRTSNLKSVDIIKEMVEMSKAEIFTVYALRNTSRWVTDEISGRQYSDGISEIRHETWESDAEHQMFQRGMRNLKNKGLAIKLNNKQYMINPLAIIPTDREVAIRQWNNNCAEEFKITN